MVHPAAIVGICLGCYVLSALVLVRVCPFRNGKKKMELLRKRFPYPVTVIAHRGGCLIGPENTIYTFNRAIAECNSNMLELDVHLSKDHKVVVCHDADLERICGAFYTGKKIGDILVGDDPNATLPQLLRKIPLHFNSSERGDYYEATEAIPVNEHTRICLLSEVLDLFPEVPLHIDIKCEGRHAVVRVLEMLEQYHREDRTAIGSSNWRNRKYIHQYITRCPSANEAPRVRHKRFRIFAGPVDYAIVYLTYFLGLLPLIPLSFDVFSIPLFTRHKKNEFHSCTKRFITYFLNSPTLWEHLQRRGILVLGWVLNDLEEFEEASKWPINGIMSDDPIALRAFFESHDTSETMNLLH